MSRIGSPKNPASLRKGGLYPSCEGGSLAQLVEVFEKEWVPSLVAELEFYARQYSLEEVILVATEKGHPHLNRISPEALKTTRGRLLRSAKLRGEFADFDQLYATVEGEMGKICGIGLLTTYDTAHRIGAYLGLKPQKVYLQTGAKKGAQILGVGRGKRKVEKQAFPKEIQLLEPQFIEDFLCICRQSLLRVKASNPADRADGNRKQRGPRRSSA
jgi:hypothetical protein